MGFQLPRSQKADTGWCGPQCLANAIALYGIPTTVEEAAGACRTPDTNSGASFSDLARGLKHYGFKGIIQRYAKKGDAKKALAWVQRKTEAGQIIVIGVNGNYENAHYILLLDLIRSGAHIFDPNEELSKIITRRNLLQAWWNTNAPGDPEAGRYLEGIELLAMSPRSRLAKRAVEIRRNLRSPPRGALETSKAFPTSFPEAP